VQANYQCLSGCHALLFTDIWYIETKETALVSLDFPYFLLCCCFQILTECEKYPMDGTSKDKCTPRQMGIRLAASIQNADRCQTIREPNKDQTQMT